jgi:endonuclease YncB( thermonuclease family)
MKAFITSLVVLLSIQTANAETITGQAEVIDGDTIRIGDERIRLFGIDAPEIKQTCWANGFEYRCGLRSKEWLEMNTSNRTTVCQYDSRDRYRRIIGTCRARVYDDDSDITEETHELNAAIVVLGWAVAYVEYSDRYVEAEQMAKRSQFGIWGANYSFTMPWQYRQLMREQE